MTATESYVLRLAALKTGELGLLRSHAGQHLDETLEAFDLFSGIWWPLRQVNPATPRREVAWLAAKLYAARPVEHARGETLAGQLGRCQPPDLTARKRNREKFDRLLSLPLRDLEPHLFWALDTLGRHSRRVDWVKLIDDVSAWEKESIRLCWAEEFLGYKERS